MCKETFISFQLCSFTFRYSLLRLHTERDGATEPAIKSLLRGASAGEWFLLYQAAKRVGRHAFTQALVGIANGDK